jgi:hypothetical protein
MISIPEDRIPRLLNMLAQQATCEGCAEPIWFLKMYKSGKMNPIDKTGQSHYANCPQAKRFHDEAKAKQKEGTPPGETEG